MLDHSSVASVRPYCDVGCGLLINTSDGKIIDLEYMKSHTASEGALCPKCNACLKNVYHKGRLRYPLKKVGEGLVRILWGEALGLVAQNLKRIQPVYEPNALDDSHPGSGCFSSCGFVSHP